MIILDTNVVSEPMKRSGSAAVRAWLDEQVVETLYLTAISLSELLVGIETLPKGKRKEGLSSALTELVSKLFGSRILPFDRDAAFRYAAVVSRAKTRGHILSVADAQIAAIAEVHGFAVATRNVTPFKEAGVRVINPWEINP